MIHPHGWRYSLGCVAKYDTNYNVGPAIILLLGSFVISNTPTSLIARKKVLKKIRGVDNVDTEYAEILHTMVRR